MTRRLTSTSAIELATWLIIASVGCGAPRPWGKAHVVEAGLSVVDARTIEIAASRDGFTPNQIAVRVGELVRLRFERIVRGGCAKEVIVRLDDGREIRRDLPFKIPIEIVLELDSPGALGFTCGMYMLGGTIDVQP